MFISWEEAKQKYPDKWVVFKDPKYNDIFHMEFVGGYFVGTAEDMESMESLMPNLDDGYIYAPRHTREDEAVGILKSGI